MTELVLIAQNSQFLWYPNLNVKNWEKYYSFWNSINLLSIDVVITAFGYINEFIIFEVIMIGFIFVVTILIFCMKFMNKSLPKVLLVLAKIFCILISEIFFIPTCILFFVIFKYSKTPRSYVDEYPNQLPGSKVDFGVYGQILAVCVIGFVILLAFVCETCNYDVRHSSEDLLETRKIHAKADYMIKLNYLLNSYFFTTIQLTNYYTYLSVALFLYSLTTLIFLYYIPFYSPIHNYLKLFSQLTCCSMCFCFWLGYTLNNSGITFLLSISTFPIIIFFSYILINVRLKHISTIQEAQRKNFHSFELAIRNYLKPGSNNAFFFKHMKKNFKISQNKLIWVLQSYYSLYNLNNCTLAITKIAVTDSRGFNIPQNYQVYKCRNIVRVTCENASAGYRILDYFIKFEIAKEKDYEFCKNYIKFFNIFLEKTVSLSSLKDNIQRLVKSIETVKTIFKDLNKKFPDSVEVKHYYGSLLSELLNNNKKGKKLLSESMALHSYTHQNKTSEFSAERGNIVVTMSQHQLKLIYYNQVFLSILKYPLNFSDDLLISMILPKALTDWLKDNFCQYCKTSVSHEILKNSRFYLVDKNGFLIECIANIESISCGEKNYFWILIDPVFVKAREFAILNETGMVLEHSEKFCYLINEKNKKIKGSFIQEFIDDVDLKNRDLNRCYLVNKREDLFEEEPGFYLIKQHEILDISFLVIYLSDDEDLKVKWEHSDFFLLENQSIFISGSRKSNKGKVKFHDENQIKDSKMNIDDKRIFSNSILTFSSSSSTFHTNLRESKEMKDSLKAFKYSKYLTSFSVIYIQVCILILIFIGMMANTYYETSATMNNKVFNDVQKVKFKLNYLAFMIRSLDVAKAHGLSYYFSVDQIEKEIGSLKTLNEEIINSKSILAECGVVGDLIDYEISYWEYGEGLMKKSGIASKVVSFIITTSQSVMIKFKKDEDYSNQLVELLFSIYHSLESHLVEISNEYVSCLSEKVNDSLDRQTILFYLGAFTSVLIFLLTCIYMYLVEGNIKLLWELLRMQVKTESLHIRHAIISRLSEYHFENEEIRDNADEGMLDSIKIVKHFIRYIIRFSFICAVCISMYSLSNFYFFPLTYKTILSRPLILNKLQNLKSNTMKFTFFTIESHLDLHNSSIRKSSNSIYVLEPNLYILTDTIKLIQNYHSDIYNKKVTWFTKQNFKDRIYEIQRKYDAGMRFGLVAGQDLLIQDSNYIANNYQIEDSLIEGFVKNCFNSSQIIEEMYQDAESASDEILKSLIRNFTIFCITCFFILLTLNYFSYHKYLNSEIAIINNIIEIIELVPASIKRSTNTGFHFSS